ncbi:MAG TPA: NAD(P)H-dependent oxidoreductase [Clostridia bacterium]|nr:NAD(P)H-dependent oxidoreductase [Clostridia bacterium]
MAKNIGVLVGSLRKESYSKKIARVLAGLFPEDCNVSFVEIGDLELYNQDYDDEGRVPESYTGFRSTMSNVEAVLFVTPEYNRSVPAVLKNALDVGSRPKGKSIWDGKPAAIVSVSPGAIGAFGANHHLRQSLVFVNMPTVQQPEAYIGHVNSILNESGEVTDAGTLKFLRSVVDALVALADRQ